MDVFGLSLLAVFTIALTLLFEFVNGFHDSANSIATIVATRVLSPVKAVGLAAAFNLVGAVFFEGVAKTIGTGIIDKQLVQDYGVQLILCAVVGAIVWDLITWWFGLPVSSSHALVGGLIGAGGAIAALDAIVWSGTMKTIIFIVVSPAVGFVAAFLLTVLVMRIARKRSRSAVNKQFRRLQIVSSSFYSFTHGTNDAQKGMGIIQMLLLVEAGTLPASDFDIELWVKIMCATTIALGTFFGGWRIVKTMASRITHLDPYQGFCAETGAAIMLFSTARLGIPVSTTHTISGGIMGVGATRRLSAVRWGVGRRIIFAWIVTIPASATIAGALFLVVNALGV